jgi:hypothetical protein
MMNEEMFMPEEGRGRRVKLRHLGMAAGVAVGAVGFYLTLGEFRFFLLLLAGMAIAMFSTIPYAHDFIEAVEALKRGEPESVKEWQEMQR